MQSRCEGAGATFPQHWEHSSSSSSSVLIHNSNLTLILVVSGRGAIFIVHFCSLAVLYPSLNISSPWSCGCRGFRCICWLLAFIAIHHLFIFSFRKGGRFRHCIVICSRRKRRPAPTWVVLSLLPHSLPFHSIMLIPTWALLGVPHTMRSCSLSVILTILLCIALWCQYHKMKPCHRGWQWAEADAPHMETAIKIFKCCYKECSFSEHRLLWVFSCLEPIAPSWDLPVLSGVDVPYVSCFIF